MTKMHGNQEPRDMLGLTEGQYNRQATLHCKLAIGLWLFAGASRNLWSGRLLTVSTASLFFPGIFIASALAFIGLVPYLRLVQAVDRFEVQGRKSLALSATMLGLLWWIGLILVAPAWLAVVYVDASHSLFSRWLD